MRLSLLISIFLRSFTVISAFGIFLISSYKYGPEGRGVISFVTSFYVIFSLFFTFGLGRVFYQNISRDVSKLRSFLEASSRQIGVTSVLVFLSLVVMGVFFSSENKIFLRDYELKYFLLCIGTLPFYMWQNYSGYFYSSAQKVETQDQVIFIGRLSLLVAMALVAALGASLEVFLGAFSLGSVAVVVAEIGVLKARFKHQSTSTWKDSIMILQRLMPQSGWPFLDSIAQSFLLPATTFLLGFYVSKDDLGIFNFSMQMLVALLFPFTVLQSKLQQSLVNQEFAKREFVRFSKDLVPLVIGVVAGGMLIPLILPYVGLGRFHQSADLLRGLLFTVPVIASVYLFQSFWIGLHSPKVSSFANLLMGIINACAILILGAKIGVWAGVVSLFVAHLIGVLAQAHYLKGRWSSL